MIKKERWVVVFSGGVDEQVAAACAPEVSAEVLYNFLGSYDCSLKVAERVFAAGVCDAEAFARVVQSLSVVKVWRIVYFKWLDEDFLRVLVDRRWGDAVIMAAVAAHRNTGAGLLNVLGGHPGVYVKAAVASRPKTGASVVNRLSFDEEKMVRLAVAKRKKLDGDVLERLLWDEDWEVRAAAANNVRVKSGSLVEMLEDTVRFVVDGGVDVDRLGEDFLGSQLRCSTPGLFDVFVNIFRNKNLPAHVLSQYVVPWVRVCGTSFVGNKNCDTQLLHTIFGLYKDVYVDVSRPGVGRYSLEAVNMVRAVAAHREADEALFVQLLDLNDKRLDDIIANNVSAPLWVKDFVELRS